MAAGGSSCAQFDGGVIMAEEHPRESSRPANDNGPTAPSTLDPRILRIAQALGRQLARDLAASPTAANDNAPHAPSPERGQGGR